ncbi:MAG: hypothetical protein LUH82_01910 [Clostridiales bacterium]|nr:hypothetical protein [Clostridiales bacterium]
MIDYDFYTDEYKGTIIPSETEFECLVVEAAVYVDNLIQTQQAREYLEYDRILLRYNLAVCAAADVTYKQNEQNENILSESVGNHSISYGAKTTAELEAQKLSKVMTYLRGTGLLYGGLH